MMLPAFFEGPEKKAELVLVPGAPSLRERGHDYWEGVVRSAHAKVLSVRSTDQFDAYLLSESSLFVYDDHLTMITCGRTRLADAISRLIHELGSDAIEVLIFERKNEHFPEEQPTSFYDDARRLRDALGGGVALRFGNEDGHRVQMFHTEREYAPDDDDTTLEILMHGIHPQRAAEWRAASRTTPFAERFGLDRVLPGFDIDEYVFDPAGYSLNALSGRLYYTVHVTPERVGSYVSFETNWDFRNDTESLVGRIVQLFAPESFDVVSFVPGDCHDCDAIDGYQLRKHVRQQLCGYGVTFQHFFHQERTGPLPAVPLDLR